MGKSYFRRASVLIITAFTVRCYPTGPDRMVLNDELSIHLRQGQLTAGMMRINGSVMISNPLTLRAGLQIWRLATAPSFVGLAASWTLVFGVEPQKPEERIVVNGHRTVQHSTPASLTPGYTSSDIAFCPVMWVIQS